jgi:hypothetical protein
MKRIALLAVIGAGLMALPSSAAAQTACRNGAPAPGVQVTPIPGGVYACVDVGGGVGGESEISVSPTGSYGWVDGFDNNPGSGTGYAGLNAGGISDTSKDSNCDGVDAASSSNNSGGCFWIKGAPAAVNNALQNPVTAMFICGNTSGGRTTSTRDGCSIP